MCGIFGVLSDRPIEPARFIHLGERNTERGNLGFGGLTWSPAQASPRVFRYSTPFDPSKLALDGVHRALGHVRAPTGGQSDRIAEIHPFVSRDVLLAHNGLLINHADFPDWRLDPALQVDSQVIAGGIQHHLDAGFTPVGAIRATVEHLDGQQACWLWHLPTKAVYLWRVMAPVYVSNGPDWLNFSSVRDDLAQNLIEEGIIYRLELLSFVDVGSFTFYNPFKVG